MSTVHFPRDIIRSQQQCHKLICSMNLPVATDKGLVFHQTKHWTLFTRPKVIKNNVCQFVSLCQKRSEKFKTKKLDIVKIVHFFLSELLKY